MNLAYLRITFALSILFFMSSILDAQDNIIIKFKNPSFEGNLGQPSYYRSDEEGFYKVGLRGWRDCGKGFKTPFDIQPGLFEVDLAPSDGNSYVGLVTRDDRTNESLTQKLKKPLQKLQAYEIQIDLAKSINYISATKNSTVLQNFSGSCVLIIYGANSNCQKFQMLAVSPVIDHTEWKNYKFLLIPARKYSHITFEIYYYDMTAMSYNGNLLIDNLSSIRGISKHEVSNSIKTYSNDFSYGFNYPSIYFK